MGRENRGIACFLLAAFVASILSLWAHDLAGHEPGAPDCEEDLSHFCTDEAQHHEGPCLFCGLRASGREADQESRLLLPVQVELSDEAPEAGPAFACFARSAYSRGPPPG